MSAILEQLGLDQTFFFQFAIFAALFFVLSQTYFKPFLKLFEARHKKTVEDREAAERLMLQAQAKLEEYQQRLQNERAAARKEYEQIIANAKQEETRLLTHARDEAKRITQDAIDAIGRQKDELRKQLEVDVESLARNISERLLSRKV